MRLKGIHSYSFEYDVAERKIRFLVKIRTLRADGGFLH